MKKIVVSMGIAVAGTAALQMTCAAQVLSSDGPKLWNVSASLSGFYDDNYATVPNSSKKGSFGLEFSPTISASVPLTQTEVGILYTYDLQYFEQRDHIGVNPVDQSHTFDLWLDHSFDENWQVKLNNSFVSGQDPELLIGSGTPFRAEGNNIVNNATIELDTDWTREFSTALTYINTFVDYEADQYASTLNRDQNSIALDLQYHITPETMAFVGYQFGIVNYTAGEQIGSYGPPPGAPYFSSARDNYSHYGYVGLQHNLLPNLVAAGKVGVQYNDAYNNPNGDSTALSPYVDLSLIYTYMPGCNAQLGFTQTRNATDVAAVSSTGSLTQDQESSSVHASINHRLTPKLLVTLIGAYNAGTYHNGPYNNETDDDYGFGLTANYAFTRNLSANLNYNYDNLTSSISGRPYERNRISIGMTVAY